MAQKVAFVFLLLFILPESSLAASLSVSPNSGTFEPGATFSVGINAASQGEVLNAVSGVVSYPASLLEVVSVSKSQSIISLWVQEPFFSNSAGTINFEGIVLSPGYSGSSGRVLNVTFRVKSAGQANLAFSSGSILANDGEGTEILTSKSGAAYTIESVADIPPPTPTEESLVEVEAAGLLPVVTSDSYPANGWSLNTTGVFKFSFAAEVTAMRLLLDENPESIPTVVYTPPINEREIKDLPEGTSYLHVQYRDANGWGEILHYKIQIDTKSPETFVVTEVEPGIFLFEATDARSGIARYEVAVDGGPGVEFIDDGTHRYTVPEQPAGAHTLSVKAFDAAGNFITASTSFVAVAKSIDVLPVVAVTEPVVATNNSIVTNGTVLITILSIIIPSLALILLLGGLLYLAWRAAGGLRRRIDKEVKEANLVVHKAFDLLRADLELDVETLKKATKKRKLTREESKILKRLQSNLDEAERVISKEVTDIENELVEK